MGDSVAVGDGVAVGEAVGEAESVAEGVPLRSVVVSEPLRSAEVLSLRSSSAGSLCVSGSSGPSAEANANPATAEITVATRAHAGATTTTTTTRSPPRMRCSRRRSHRSTANAHRIKANATNSATSTATVMLSIILTHHPTTQGPSLYVSWSTHPERLLFHRTGAMRRTSENSYLLGPWVSKEGKDSKAFHSMIRERL